MEVKMDPDQKARRMSQPDQRVWQSNNRKPNLLQWLLIISLGVFIGNVAAIGVERGITYWEIYQVAKVLETETEKMKLRRDAQAEINREQARAREIENQKKQAGLRQALETCKFWRDQLAKSNTPENKMHRDTACELVGQFR